VHVSPADETVTTTVLQTWIDWTDVSNWFAPISYVYQSSPSTDANGDGSFTSPVYTSAVLSTSEIPTPGTPAGIYYWHVKAVDSANNSSGWTFPWKITVDNTPPEDSCNADATVVVVSDASTQVDAQDSLLITPHPAYTSIAGASWIWSDESTVDDDGVMSAEIGVKTFTKTFTINGTPLDSSLEVGTYTLTENNIPTEYYMFTSEGCSNVLIEEGQTKTCTFTNYDTVILTGGSGGGNGLGGGTQAPVGQILGASTENNQSGTIEGQDENPIGEVLGESTKMCVAYLSEYMYYNKKSNPAEVKLLQSFLNETLGLSLVVDGKFGKNTKSAVIAFQEKFKEEILTPWGIKNGKGTGNIYKTTKWKINDIKCPGLETFPQLP